MKISTVDKELCIMSKKKKTHTPCLYGKALGSIPKGFQVGSQENELYPRATLLELFKF